ncbi:MAG TPA: hypothetical protein DEW32_04490 [Dehalococcoidia bacterium]|nr:hypothetical protein [Dehalococcoidia bacterium]
MTFEDPATVDTDQTVGEQNDISLVGTTNVFVSYLDNTAGPGFGGLVCPKYRAELERSIWSSSIQRVSYLRPDSSGPISEWRVPQGRR